MAGAGIADCLNRVTRLPPQIPGVIPFELNLPGVLTALLLHQSSTMDKLLSPLTLESRYCD